MEPSSPEYVERLAELRADYRRRLPGRIAGLEETWQALCGEWELELAREFFRQVHNLAGSAQTYGFPYVSEAARALEEAIHDALLEEGTPDENQQVQIDICMTALRSSLG